MMGRKMPQIPTQDAGERFVSWQGRSGRITEVRNIRGLKPYVVLHDDDGSIGYYHVDQIRPVEEADGARSRRV